MDIGSHYCSFWPQGGAGKKDFKKGTLHEPSFSPNIRLDRRVEGRDPDHKVSLQGLDEGAMLRAWQSIQDNRIRYNMVKHNCSTVIAVLLETGSGIKPFFSPVFRINEVALHPAMKLYLQLRFLGNQIAMWTPENLYRYALEIQKARQKP